MKPYDFLKQDRRADSVNPSLWRQAQLNAIHGLFKVTERVYQVRGFDLANMTIIEGDTGADRHRSARRPPKRRAPRSICTTSTGRSKPVGAVIYTHSHGDHFGGVRGVISEADVAAGQGPGAGAGGLHGGRGRRERARRQRHEPARAVPVRHRFCRPARAARSTPASARRSAARHDHA